MKLNISILFFIFTLITACSVSETEKIIVISADTHQKSITKWISNFDKDVKIVILYKMSEDSIDFYLSKASGIIITGGEDVNPNLYGKPELSSLCGTINSYRDSLEIKMINFALQNKVPLLGVCRGLQIMNVSQGGSLFPDIPTYFHDSIHRKSTGHTNHLVTIVKNTQFATYFIADTGTVYSNHHQAINDLADVFEVTAFALDSVIEAIEIKDTNKYNFAVAVQWHPEAMDYNDEFGKPLAISFLTKVETCRGVSNRKDN